MHVFFVRHGETELNKKHVHQSPVTPLSPKGREQALTAAEYLRPMNPERIVTSGYRRALETARIIGSVLDLTPQRSDFFREIERPSNLAGTSLFAPQTFWYVASSVMHQKNPAWRYRDAENFNDVYRRVQYSLAFIESLRKTHKSIIIVSHTMYINLMIAYMCHDRILSIQDLVLPFLHIGTMSNCSVVEVVYAGATVPNTCTWQLVSRDTHII